MELPAAGEPSGENRDPGVGRGRKWGSKRRGKRWKTQSCDAGRRLSGRGWRGVGVGDVQVDAVPGQERRWGEGVNYRCGDENRYLWEAVGGGETKRSKKRLRQVGREARIKVLIV